MGPTCPDCGHPLAFHREHEGDTGARYGSSHYCDERMSYDNNDFCGCTHGAPPKETYVFYAVADRDDLKKAKWYRTYSASHGSGWVDDLDDAKVWAKRGSAKGKATALGASARLVEFHVTKVVVIDQTEHLKKVAEKRRQEEERQQKARAQWELQEAERALKAAQAKVDRLRKE